MKTNSIFELANWEMFKENKKAKDSHNRLSRYTNSENELTHQCDATAIYDLTAQSSGNYSIKYFHKYFYLKRSKISERNCPILGLLKDAVAN
jgi:hypothetical protein